MISEYLKAYMPTENPRKIEVAICNQYAGWQKSLMAKWLEQESQWHEMYCHDLEVMSSNPSQVELGVRSTSKSYLIQKFYLRPDVRFGSLQT